MRKERLARGWSLRGLSPRTQVDFATLSRIENGKRPPTEKLASRQQLDLLLGAAFGQREPVPHARRKGDPPYPLVPRLHPCRSRGHDDAADLGQDREPLLGR